LNVVQLQIPPVLQFTPYSINTFDTVHVSFDIVYCMAAVGDTDICRWFQEDKLRLGYTLPVFTGRVDEPCSRVVWTGARVHGP